jgi:hypothetical protein
LGHSLLFGRTYKIRHHNRYRLTGVGQLRRFAVPVAWPVDLAELKHWRYFTDPAIRFDADIWNGMNDGSSILLPVSGAYVLPRPIHALPCRSRHPGVLAWGRSGWIAVGLVMLSGLFAELSRYTWILAPAIWAVMLEFGSWRADGGTVPSRTWWRSLALGTAGLFGSLILPRVLDILGLNPSALGSAPGVAAGGVSLTSLAGAATRQPHRPNAPGPAS